MGTTLAPRAAWQKLSNSASVFDMLLGVWVAAAALVLAGAAIALTTVLCRERLLAARPAVCFIIETVNDIVFMGRMGHI